MTAFFTVVMMTNSGFFYVSFMEEFHVDRESASWPASVVSVVAHSSGLLVSIGQGKLSVFQMGMLGSVFLWAGMLGAAFAPNIMWMTLTLGLIHGVGLGVVCVTLILVVMMYFDKYRGMASGLKFAGYSLCSLLYPIILTSLKDAYGFRGALLVCAALTMNVTALSLLLKEPPWHDRERNSKHANMPLVAQNGDTSTDIDTLAGEPGSLMPTPRSLIKPSVCNLPDSVASHGTPESLQVYKLRNILPSSGSDRVATGANLLSKDRHPLTATRPLQSLTEKSHSTVSLCTVNSPRVKSSNTHLVPKNSSAPTEEKAPGKPFGTGKEPAKEPYLAGESRGLNLFQQSVKLLAAPKFYVVVLAVVAIDYTVAVFPATIVDYALDKGSARSQADLSVSYCAPAELMGRVALPLIADSGLVSRTTLVSVNFFLLAGTFLALPATCSFLSYILVCACATMFSGCLMSMKPVVIADYFGIDAVATAWGFAGVTLLPLLLCSPTITGYFRDTKGSYDGLYQLQAGIHGCVGSLFGILSVLDHRRQKKWVTN